MRRVFLIPAFLFTTVLGSAFAETPSFDEIRPRAIEVLRNDLHNADQWFKVHAAEMLLQLSYPEGVEEEFQQELALHGEQIKYRIGIRRVLARAAVLPQGKRDWIVEIKTLFFDPQASDRMTAIETLGKLEVQLTDDEKEVVAQYAQTEQDPFAFWILAQNGSEDAISQLECMKESDDALLAFRAGYCLKKFQPVSKEEWLAGGGLEQAESALKSEDVTERKEACQILGRFGTAEGRGLLIPLMNDPDPDVRIYAAGALLRIDRRQDFGIQILDWVVIFGYALGMLLIGWHYSRKTKTIDDYLLGGRDMKPWMVGLSLFATLLSTITYMAYPGEIIKHGPMIAAGLIGMPLVIWVVGWFLIPAFMKTRVTSANEILEMRMGPSVRVLGSFFFLALRLMWMAMIIYVTTKAVLGPVLGLDPKYFPMICFLLGAITVVYTSMGGLKAVILTDVIQTFILFFGAILSIILISMHFGGFSWFPTQWEPGWDPAVFWFDADARITFAGSLMMFLFWNICTAGSDQMAVQRYLSTGSVKEARSAFTISMGAGVLVQILLALLGFALISYFIANPQELADGMNIQTDADQVFPRFIISSLPVGITGLVVAVLLAAAMSSLSSGLNSAGTIITVDFLDRFGKKKLDEKYHIKRARIVSWLIGVSIVILSLLVGNVEGNLLEVINKVGNLLVAPLFLLFFMAIFVPFANTAGVWVGAVVSVAMAIAIAFYEFLGLSFIWIMPCSLIAGVISGCLASLLTGGKKKSSIESA